MYAFFFFIALFIHAKMRTHQRQNQQIKKSRREREAVKKMNALIECCVQCLTETISSIDEINILTKWIIQRKNLFPIVVFMMFVPCHRNWSRYLLLLCIYILALSLPAVLSPIENSSKRITIKNEIEQQIISIFSYLFTYSFQQFGNSECNNKMIETIKKRPLNVNPQKCYWEKTVLVFF